MSQENYEPPKVVDGTLLGRLTEHAEARPAPNLDEPVLPLYFRDKATRRATNKAAWRRVRRATLKALFNTPRVAGLLLFVYPPSGAWRIISALSRYLYDWDSAQVRHQHAARTETDEYRAAQRLRSANLRARWMVAGTIALLVAGPLLAWTYPRVLSGLVGAALCVWIVKLIPDRSVWELVLGAGAGVATWWFLPQALEALPQPPGWALFVLLVAGDAALGWHGRPRAKQLVKDVTALAGGPPPLRADLIVGALCALGNGKMKDPESVKLLGDLHRNGPGVQADLELPPAVPAKYVMENREEFAAALRREMGTVWPSVGKRHPGHLVVYVGDEALAVAEQDEWPLLKRGEVDLARPFPAFTDQRGQWVELTLAYANMIIGAVPRMGKTYILRQLGLSCALDKRAKLYVYDGKGTGDLAPLALVAHSYVRGPRPDRPEKIDKVRRDIAELLVELGRRTDVIDSLPRDVVPESKVTSELMNARPDLDLGWIVVVMDETQSFFEYGQSSNRDHKAIRTELADSITDLVKLGPAVGIILLLATQQVNKQTIPTGIANNAVQRFCLKMEGWEPNDRVLGSGAYKRGVDATMFDFEEKGIGYLKSEGSLPRIVRSVYGLDAVASEKVALRGRRLREAAGFLTGDAAGEDLAAEEQQIDLLDDARKALDAEGGRNMSLARLRDHLAAARSTWAHLDVDSLGGMLREAGARPDSIWCPAEGRSMQGVKREWLDVDATEVLGGDLSEDDGEAPAPVIDLGKRRFE